MSFKITSDYIKDDGEKSKSLHYAFQRPGIAPKGIYHRKLHFIVQAALSTVLNGVRVQKQVSLNVEMAFSIATRTAPEMTLR
jgi:hypothetical protein